MEFHAYSNSNQKSNLWKIQSKLRGGDSLMLPGLVLLLSASFVAYEHMVDNRTNIKNFLGLILISMLPLAALEKQMVSCADPLSVISKFSGKLILSHGLCFCMRTAVALYDPDATSRKGTIFCVLFACVSCALLPAIFGVRSPRALLTEQLDVWITAALAVVAALMTESFSYYWWPQYRYRQNFTTTLLGTMGLNLELVAFIPAIATAYRMGKRTPGQGWEEVDAAKAKTSEAKNRAMVLSFFLLAFYVQEDVVEVFKLFRIFPVAALAHLAHYALLLDFAGFLLSHFFDPAKIEKLTGALRDIFTDVCAV